MKNRFYVNLILQILTLISFLDVNGQTLFNKKYGTQFYEEGTAITATNDGGFAVAGMTEANGGGGNIFLMKLNDQGIIQWQKDIFGVNIDEVYGVYQLSNGSFILGGNTYSYGSGCVDALEVMMDSTGNLLWSKAYGDVSCNSVNSFSLAHGDGFIAAGDANNDGWLLKTGPNGALEWSKTYPSSGFTSVTPTIDGGYLAAGTIGSITVLKVDSVGNPIWLKGFLTLPGNTHCYDLVALDDGSAVLTGQLYLNAFGGIADLFLAKLDANGFLVWFKTYGFTFEEYGLSLKKTPDDGFIVAGWTSSFGHGDEDALLLKTNDSGDLEWAKTYGGAWSDRAEQIQVLSDSSFVFVGTAYTSSSLDSSYVYVVKTDPFGNSCEYFDWTPLVQTQNYITSSLTTASSPFGVDSICTVAISDFLFAEKNICVINSIAETDNKTVEIFPNPVNSELIIKGLNANSIIKLFAASGKLIYTQKANEETILDVSFLSQGVYFLQVGNEMKKIVKI